MTKKEVGSIAYSSTTWYNTEERLPATSNSEKPKTNPAVKERDTVNTKDTISQPYSIDNPPLDSPELSA